MLKESNTAERQHVNAMRVASITESKRYDDTINPPTIDPIHTCVGQ
jgi:hypothetical protein